MASNFLPVSIEDRALSVIKRIAIDTSGCLGSLYDAYRNRVLEKTDLNFKESPGSLVGKARCVIKPINRDQSSNLLELIDLDEDLRLSIILNMIHKDGLASLMDYSHPINEYTRFLHYTYTQREEQLSTDAKEVQRSPIPQTDATHIITGVTWGVDFVAVLQFPSDPKIATRIDGVLEKIRAQLENSNDISSLTTDDRDFLEKFCKIEAHSNVSQLMKMTSLLQMHQYITELKQKSDTYRPLAYALEPIEWVYPDAHKSCPPYKPLKQSDSGKLEQHLLGISNHLKEMKHSLDSNLSKVLPDALKNPLLAAENQWHILQKAYEDVIARLEKLISDIRSERKDASDIDQALKHEDQTILQENIQTLIKRISDLEANTQLINSSPPQELEYYNTVKHQVNQNENEQTLKRKLITENQQNQPLYSGEKLTDNNQAMLSTEQINNEKRNRQSLCSSFTETQTSATLPPLLENEIINILLLGESGVGKSTFINAFVNYLTYETLNEAESKQPVVLIPVSFMMTTGDNFTEQIVKLNVSDTLNNEDFKHPGQSVTQRCRSYVFHLKHHEGKELRIIDTPGFGDTRGLDQDDFNMQQILEYINNLTHLNAVCFLLKPNTSRLNICFRTCLTQLLDFLGSNIRQNIIFCFTNSRATFYTPGDTAPLLKAMLKSLLSVDILFQKENTFCFDSESFRYLAALKNGIAFNNQEKYEYEASWLKSVTEFNRLFNYIGQNPTVYRMHDDWKSIKHAQLEIKHMIRPILEAMRNTLRNTILHVMDSMKRSIAICPKPIHRPTTICSSCKHELIQTASFWFLPDCSHGIQDESHKCSSASNQHISLDYILDYNIAHAGSIQQKDELRNQLSLLNDASATFSNFLMHTAAIPKDDLFLTGLQRMLAEEKYICVQKNSNNLNMQLSEELEKLMHKYTYRLHEVKQNEKCTQLSFIYNLIMIIRDVPEVHIQLATVKRGQEYMMEQYEYKVSNDAKNASTLQPMVF